ncbi:potassium-transporting ATPase subunit KdpC [Methylosoma difficile]
MQITLKPALSLLLLFTVLTGIVYPLLVTISTQVFFPYQANGSLLTKDDKQFGSVLIGQNFTRPGYFWGRPSATSPAYNAAASSGSNLGPTNPALIEAVKGRIEHLHTADPSQTGAVPADLVMASASGLDPHISPAAALYQAHRVAMARHLPVAQVEALVARFTEARQFGFLGEPRINVLKLNLALEGRLN